MRGQTKLCQNSRSLDQNLNMKFLELKSEIVTTSVNFFILQFVAVIFICSVKYLVLCNLCMC
jgi:hypothetical protein